MQVFFSNFFNFFVTVQPLSFTLEFDIFISLKLNLFNFSKLVTVQNPIKIEISAKGLLRAVGT